MEHLQYTVLYYMSLYYTIYYIILYEFIPYYTILYYVFILYYTLLYWYIIYFMLLQWVPTSTLLSLVFNLKGLLEGFELYLPKHISSTTWLEVRLLTMSLSWVSKIS